MKIIDPASSPHERLIGYDSLSRRLTMSDPDTGLWTFHYDLNGNLDEQWDANGQHLRFTYETP